MARFINTNPFARKPEITPGDAIVITPHRAAARALGVRYHTLARLAIEVLRNNKLHIAPSFLAKHLLKKVIAEVVPGSDPTAFANRILQILETVLRTGIEPDQLIKHGSPRVKQLGAIAKRYRSEIRKRNYVDRAELLWAATECKPEPRKIIVCGHYRARKEEIMFIDAIAGEGSRYFLPGPEHADFGENETWIKFLLSKDWTLEEEKIPAGAFTSLETGEKFALRFIGRKAEAKNFKCVAYPNLEAEVRGVLSQIKQLLIDGEESHEIAVVCRDLNLYTPVIDAMAREFALPVRMENAVSLNETKFGGFINHLFEAAENFSYEAMARMIFHPFGPGLPEGTWKIAREQRPTGRDAWSKLSANLRSFTWSENQKLSEWNASLKKILEEFDVRKKAASRTREILAYEKFTDSLKQIEKLEGARVLTFEQFAAIAFEILSDVCVPYRPAKAGVEIFEPNTILAAKFDHLFILGMAEGIFPAPIVDNPVIDFFERKNLRDQNIEFEEAAEVARWETMSFYFTLLAARKNVYFSYPKTVENAEQVAGSFFERLNIEPLEAEAEIRFVSSIEERRRVFLRGKEKFSDDPEIDFAREQFKVEARREISESFDEYDGVIGERFDPASRWWSVSQLTTIGQCAFRWFAQRILRLQEVQELELGMDYAKRGSFYHKVLELAVGKAKDASDIRAATLENLDAAFAEAEADEEVELPMLSNWELQRGEHLNALRKAIESVDFIQEGARVIGLEQNFKTEWQGFKLMGYIDRIDDTPNGLIAIDYKTSSSAPKGAQDESGKLNVDVQIPLYSQIALRHLYPEGNLGNSVYYSLTNGKILREEKPEDFEKLSNLSERIKQILARGAFAVDPDIDEVACKNCDYEIVCRKGPRLNRKVTD